MITGVHQLVGEDNRILKTNIAITGIDQLGYGLLVESLVDQREWQSLRQKFAQYGAPNGGFDQSSAFDLFAIFVAMVLEHAAFTARLQFDCLVLVSAQHFLGIGKYHAFTLNIDLFTGHVVQAEDNILGRYDNRLAVGRREDVIGRHHQCTHFQLSFQRQRYVHGHLVAVKVGVERGTNQRMQLDSLAFNQYRLECLDTQTMQCRCAVEHDRMLADDFLEDIPYFGYFTLYQFLRRLDGGGQAAHLQLAEDEGLE